MAVIKKFLFTFILIICCLSLSVGGYFLGKKNSIYEARKNPPTVEIINKDHSGNAEQSFGLFWQVWDMVSKDFLFRPVNSQKMLDGAIKGVNAYFANTANTPQSSESSESTPSGK